MRTWILWPDLDFPRTSTGKPRLSIIADRAAQILDGRQVSARGGGRVIFTRTASTRGSLDQLLERIGRASGEGSGASSHLEQELNLSSLDRVELLSALEERFHVELNETVFANAKTVADVERVLQQPAARRTEYTYPRWTQRELARWLRLAVYHALVWPATQILGHPRIAGRQNLRGLRVPALIISNQITRRAEIGLLAENLGIPIIPMCLDGVWKMKREHRRLAHFGEITVRIGSPVTFAPGTPPDEIAGRLESLVRLL